MLRHHLIDRICCIVLAAVLLLTCGLMSAVSLGAVEGSRSIGYENRLFDQQRVHTIDIVMNDWEGFLQGLKEINYQGNISFECGRGILVMPEEVRKEVMCLITAIGRYIRNRINEI